MPDQRRRLAAEAWGALLHLHARLVPTLDAQMRETSGLALAWYDVLLELNAAPEHRLTMSTLAERVTLSRTRVSRIVDELATAGLVCRESNPDDGRSSFAAMTQAGRAAFKRAAPPYLASIEVQLASNLNTRELTDLSALLRKIATSGPCS